MGGHDLLEVLLSGLAAAVLILGVEYLLKCRRCRAQKKAS